MSENRLGKISKVCFGIGGYQDAMLGLSVILEGDGWGVGDFKGFWDPNTIECSDHAKWTEEDRAKSHDDVMRFVSKLLKEAKVSSVDRLKGIPVSVEFEGFTLKSWRILTEVL